MPTIPASHQATWPWPWKVTSWVTKQPKLIEQSGASQPKASQDQEETLSATDPNAEMTVFSTQLAFRPARVTHHLPKPFIPATTPKPPQADLRELQDAINTVEASFDDIRSHIRPGKLSGVELQKVQQRLSECLAHVNARMECVKTNQDSAASAMIFEDGEPLEFAALYTNFCNIDTALSSFITTAERGGLSIQQINDATEKVAGLSEKAVFDVSNFMHIFSAPSPISRSPVFTPGTPLRSPQGSGGRHKRRGRSSSLETAVAAEERAAKRHRR